MSQQLIDLAAQQYTSLVQLKLQQLESVLRANAMSGTHYGKQAAVVDQFAESNYTEITTRFAPIVHTELANDRRWVAPRNFKWSGLIDSFDKLRLLNDPTSYYVRSGVATLKRAMDDVLVQALYSNAITGENGTSLTPFLSSQVLSVNEGAAGPTGMNVTKLLAGRESLMANQVDLENETLNVVLTARQIRNLLSQTQPTSSEFNDQRVLVNGELKQFLGINIIHSERLPLDANGYRRNFMWVKSGLYLGIWEDIMARVDYMPTLESIPLQVYVKGVYGATRTEEKKFVEIPCSEAAA